LGHLTHKNRPRYDL